MQKIREKSLQTKSKGLAPPPMWTFLCEFQRKKLFKKKLIVVFKKVLLIREQISATDL